MIGGTRVDRWRNTLLDNAYHGSGQQVAVAAEFAGIQLWCLAAATHWVYVHRISSVSANAKSHRLYYDTTMLPTDEYEFSKLLDGAPSNRSGQVKKDSKGTVANYGIRLSADVLCTTILEWLDGQEGIMLTPGHGITVVSEVNTPIRVIFEWIELAVAV